MGEGRGEKRKPFLSFDPLFRGLRIQLIPVTRQILGKPERRRAFCLLRAEGGDFLLSCDSLSLQLGMKRRQTCRDPLRTDAESSLGNETGIKVQRL